MPFTVDYGPISSAMQLAQGAGAAQRQQIGFGEDMQALGYLQNAQRLSQQERATEIQQSLQNQQLGIEEQRNQAQNNLAMAQMQATANYHQGLLGNQATRNANTADYQQGRVGALQQNADTNAYRADNMDQYRQLMAGIAQQNASSRQQSVDQQGMKFQQGPNQEKGLQDYYNSLATQARSMEHNASLNFADPRTDPQYQAIKQKMAEIEQNIRGNLLGGGPSRQQPPVAAPMMRQLQAQGGVPQQVQNATPQQQPGQQPGQLQFDQQGNVVPGSRGVIPSNVAAAYLQRVGYTPNSPDAQQKIAMAKQAAAAEGWTVP